MTKKTLKCDHCGIKGHVKENYFSLKGFPEWSNTKNLRHRFQNYRNPNHSPVDFNEGASNGNTQLMSLVYTVEALQKEMAKMKKGSPTRNSNNTMLVNFAYYEDFASISVNQRSVNQGT
ncbi:hypothetical protein Leryth_025759 [Lithospermum erythrorhizon]|nr:hypothetical protein Leryth_025759 [Lithospermum erythrorhizon]